MADCGAWVRLLGGDTLPAECNRRPHDDPSHVARQPALAIPDDPAQEPAPVTAFIVWGDRG